jgi:hypothetical protein
MKKHVMVAMTALGFLLVSSVSWAQTANFIYNDGNGVTNAGTYHPGDSFTFSISLAFAPGGTITNLDGLSYWFQQKSPASPFISSITLRDASGSQFSDLQTPGLTYPQNLNPSNANDLGAALPSNQAGLGAGTYFIANITVQISPTAPITGTFVLDETLSAGKTSVISDSAGHTFAIPEADYTITMVPEPGTWVAGSLVLASLLYTQRRRFARR